MPRPTTTTAIEQPHKRTHKTHGKRLQPRARPKPLATTVRAVVIKGGNVFFLTNPDGGVPVDYAQGLGLYYHDCRYLDGYEILLGGAKPHALTAQAEEGFAARLELTNTEMTSTNEDQIAKQRIGMQWERIIDSHKLVLLDRIRFNNYDVVPLSFSVQFIFSAAFQDIFVVRGSTDKRMGKCQAAKWKSGVLRVAYAGVDKVHRGLAIHFSPQVEPVGSGRCTLAIPARGMAEMSVAIVIYESKDNDEAIPQSYYPSDFSGISAALREAAQEWVQKHTRIKSSSRLFNESLSRSLRDLRVLQSELESDKYFAAGLPWSVPLGFERTHRIVDPVLPSFIEHLELRRLRVGSANADLDFDHRSDGTAEVTILQVRQDLAITVESKHTEMT